MTTATPIRLSTHALHHEANRFFEMGRQAYLERVDGRVRDPQKIAAAMLWLSYLADARGSDDFYREAHRLGARLLREHGNRASVALVWSRRHNCAWHASDLDTWVEQKVPTR